ncbi:hypothetical protein Agub_g3169 [Astrephomene gubernaculifera]|uniref:Uncharacterized protein n=1 Tax=Astrephomene gubernaculifera TaxID=47775 RepID=A0AAD3DK81_9CHLO|nr:hypothetical protein Agub_g3169 [Astrephomene gubernaculifera]
MRYHRSNSGARQSHGGQRSYQALDSPPRLKHRSGPSMSAERFLLLVDQLMSRANQLWQQEELELQRGHELMVICPSPPSPQHALQQHEVDEEPSSPPSPYAYDAASLLHPPSHCLQSPSFGPVANHLSSPTWSAELLAASLGLGQQIPDGVVEEAGATVGAGPLSSYDAGPSTAGCGQGSKEPPGGPGHHQPLCLSHHHQQQQQQHPHHQQQQLNNSSGSWQLYDAEAYITLQPVGGASSHGCGGGSGPARMRLPDKSEGGAGTASARHAQNLDPFYGLLSYTPGADDFLGSPSWGPGGLL